MYSERLQKVLREALLNNTYDKPSMNGAIKMTLENSYNYLYQLQNEYVGFEERHYQTGGLLSRKDPVKPGQLYINKYGYACVDINFQLIEPGSYERYRRGPLYQSEISFQDIVNHPEIFTYVPVLMIDGMVIDNWKLTLQTLDGYCTFTLPGKRKDFVLYNKRKFQMENPSYDDTSNTDISIYDVDSEIYQEHRIDAFIFENESKTSSLEYGAGVFSAYSNDGDCYFSIASETVLNLVDKNGDPDKGMIFLYAHLDTGSVHVSVNPSDSFLLIPASYNKKDDAQWTYAVSPRLYALSRMYPATKYTLTAVYLKGCHLYMHPVLGESGETSYSSRCIVQDGFTNFMVVERDVDIPYAMPIPKYDLMIYRMNPYSGINTDYASGNNLEFAHLKNEDTIDEFYPNIYSYANDTFVVADDDRVYSFYFYHEAEGLKYTPMHHWYYKFLRHKFSDKPLETIITGIYNMTLTSLDQFTEEELDAFYTIFSEILHYKHYKHKFGEIDFLFNYKTLEDNINSVPLEYRIDTLKEWVRQEPYTLRDYVLEQNRVSQLYHIFCNTIDLSARERMNDRDEGHGTTDFDELCYVFSFSNTRKLYTEVNNIRVFVDGLFIHDYHQIRFMNLDFIYIPCKHFVEDSYVEIELFPEYSFEKKVVFESMDDWKEILLLDPEFNIFPTLTDIYAYDSYDDIENPEVEYLNYYDAPDGVIEDSDYPYRDFADHATEDSDTGELYEVKDSLLQRWNESWKEWTDGTERVHQYDDSVFRIIAIYQEGEYEVSSVPTFDYVFDTYADLENFDKNTSLEDAVILYDDFSLAPDGLLDDMGYGPFRRHAVQDNDTQEIIEMGGYNVVANPNQEGINLIGYVENSYYYCKETDAIYYYWHGTMFVIGLYRELKPVQFTRLRHFKIAPKYEELIGKELYIRFSKQPSGFPIKLSQDGYPTITIKTKNFKFQQNYIRVFKNGRFLSRKRYAFFGNQSSDSAYPIIQILEKCYADDDIYIDITPFTYKEIYYQEELNPKDDLIDLSGYITKPYDPRYYECYINGRRMSLNNVITIEPWAITFVNLKSIYSIEIFEKERDWEYFGLDYTENIYGFTPSRLIKQPFVTEEDRTGFIQTIINDVKHPDLIIHPNTNEEEKHPTDDLTVYVQVSYFYYDELIPKRFVNPDTIQFSPELIKNEYRTIYDTYHTVPYDESEVARRVYYPGVLLLSPDIQIQAFEDKEHLACYCVGHPDEDETLSYVKDDISEYADNVKYGHLNEVMRVMDDLADTTE